MGTIPDLLTAVQGLIQGFTEIFPISSSGHLIVLSEIFGFPTMTIERAALLHLGSMFAIILVYGRPTWRALRGDNGPKVQRGVFTTVGITLLLGMMVKFGLLRWQSLSLNNVIILLSLNGLFLSMGAMMFGAPARASIPLENLQNKHFIVLGIAQGISTIPGISRLGMTLLVGLWAGLTWQDSLSLSFVVGLPVIFGVGMLEFVTGSANYASGVGQILGLVFAFAASWVSIFLIMRRPTLERRLLAYFGLYNVALAGLCAALVF
jgi:undecaprenyl-diphosphatase